MSTEKKTIKYNDLEFAVLFDEEQIQKTVRAMAVKINQHYNQLLKTQEDPLIIVICVLKGAFMFFTDLIRHFDFRIQEDFIRLSSYHAGLDSLNEVQFLTQVDYQKYKGKHILIVQDIIDTGKTLLELSNKIAVYGPKSIEIAALVIRPDKSQVISCKFIGLNCSDFIIGYGCDLDQHFRCLPQIYQKI